MRDNLQFPFYEKANNFISDYLSANFSPVSNFYLRTSLISLSYAVQSTVQCGYTIYGAVWFSLRPISVKFSVHLVFDGQRGM